MILLKKRARFLATVATGATRGRIKAAVFENGDNAPRKVQFTALYKDGDPWKEGDRRRGSASFTREDLPLLAKLAD